MLYIRSKFSSSAKDEKGLSLIEVAIGLIVLGLVMLPLIQTYKVNIATETYRESEGSLTGIKNAINQYYARGAAAYPCPADLTAGPGSTDYGNQGDCTNTAAILLCSAPGWRTAGGICKTSNNSDAVIIGGIPFADLNLTSEEGLDFWNNKLIYAVTHRQTDSATFRAEIGQITVMAVDDPVMVSIGSADGVPDVIDTEIDFFVFTTGRTALGGYSKEGAQLGACATATTSRDFENCDFDAVFFLHENPANTAASAYALVSGTTFFDDITHGQTSVPENIWFQHPDNSTYASKDYVMTLANRIGVGPNMHEPDFDVHVNGNIRTQPQAGIGRILSDTICDSDANDCFDPEIITGSVSAMRCAQINGTDRAVMRLRNSSVECSHPENVSGNVQLHITTGHINPLDCGSGQRVIGIQANGDLLCAVP